MAVSDTAIKRQIRVAAEEEEREFYALRAPPEWLEALAPLGTDAEKPFLERAPLADCHLRAVAWHHERWPHGEATTTTPSNLWALRQVLLIAPFMRPAWRR